MGAKATPILACAGCGQPIEGESVSRWERVADRREVLRHYHPEHAPK